MPPRGFDPAIGLVALLLLINLLAVFGLVASRRDVRAAIREQRSLETRADARTFEALLAQQHADLSFLARTPPLAAPSAAAGRPGESDPVVRRWARLDVEASLLLFLESRPAVQRLEVEWHRGEPRTVALQPDGVPQLAPPETPPPEAPGLVSAEWAVGGGTGRLRAWVDPGPLLSTTGPELVLHHLRPESDGPVEPVTSGLWTAPFAGWIERAEVDSGVVRSVERLAGGTFWLLLLNIALIPLSLVLVGLTLQRVRRLARLESEAAQRDRMQSLEDQVRHAERLASLGRFAAGIAHEINNPLEGMANYLQLLSDDLESGSVDDARRWLPRLREGIDRAAGTVRQVLRFAVPGRGEKRAADLAEVVESTAAFLRGHPDCRGVTITTRTPGSLPFEGDAQTLGQLVLNLVLNACQAQSAGGEVEVRACRAEDDTDENGDGDSDELVLEVLDRGPGFPSEARDELFEPFRSTRGSLGLGLAVCQDISSDHGGRISLGDRVGGGAVVRVTLPCRALEREEDL